MCSKCIFFFLNHKSINKSHKRYSLKKKNNNQVKPKTLHSFKEMNTAYIHKLKGYSKYTLIVSLHSSVFLKGPVTISYNQVHTIIFLIQPRNRRGFTATCFLCTFERVCACFTTVYKVNFQCFPLIMYKCAKTETSLDTLWWVWKDWNSEEYINF